MRSFEPPLGPSGESSIEAVALDPTSRDDIPQLLRGLQYLYMTESCRVEVLQILDEMIPEEVDRTTGRPGMVLWRILVMGVLRLNLNWDYDRLCEMVNEHRTIRQMLGHGLEDDRERYHVQTLKDNVSLLTPEIVDRINQVVVQAGHFVKPRVNWTPIWMSSSRFRILDFEFSPTHLCRGFVAMALQDPLFIDIDS